MFGRKHKIVEVTYRDGARRYYVKLRVLPLIWMWCMGDTLTTSLNFADSFPSKVLAENAVAGYYNRRNRRKIKSKRNHP